MPKFRKKPTEIEAVEVQFSEMTLHGPADPVFAEMPVWLLHAITRGVVSLSSRDARDYAVLNVRTANGTVEALPKDMLCYQRIGDRDDLWPCKPDIFAATCEPAD